VQSKIGTATFLGLYQSPWFNNEFPNINLPALLDSVEDKLGQADNHLNELYNGFFEPGSVTAVQGEMGEKGSGYSHDPDLYAAFWFHPDHLGSSNYITNLAGNISQHMEYLPFGETLVEEHLNSNNSPYKFNGKELDEETGNYYYGARYYDPKFSIWLSVDPLAEKGPQYSPYNYTFNNPINFTDPDGRWPDPPFGYRIGASLSFGSGGFGFNVTASIGVQHKTPSFQGQAFLTGSAYMGGNQLGTSSMTRGIQYDATLTGIATVGGGRGQAHNMYSVNYNMASPFQNDFKNSGSYGQALSFNSAINSEWDSSYGNRVQRSGIVGLKFGNFSFQTSNDTDLLGGDGGDRGNTGAGVANFGGLEIGYQNFTGAYNRKQEKDISFGSFYEQTDYQQSLNQSFFSIRANGFGLDGGSNNGSVQNGIHSVTNTGQFNYPGNFRVNPNVTVESPNGL
jgi:RHS repeat-associated protein